MNLEAVVIEINIGDEIKYVPAYIINGKTYYSSHQDNLVYFDTEAEAQEYLDDED